MDQVVPKIRPMEAQLLVIAAERRVLSGFELFISECIMQPAMFKYRYLGTIFG